MAPRHSSGSSGRSTRTYLVVAFFLSAILAMIGLGLSLSSLQSRRSERAILQAREEANVLTTQTASPLPTLAAPLRNPSACSAVHIQLSCGGALSGAVPLELCACSPAQEIAILTDLHSVRGRKPCLLAYGIHFSKSMQGLAWVHALGCRAPRATALGSALWLLNLRYRC